MWVLQETVVREEDEEDTLLMGSAEVSRIKRKTTTAAGPKSKGNVYILLVI